MPLEIIARHAKFCFLVNIRTESSTSSDEFAHRVVKVDGNSQYAKTRNTSNGNHF